MSELHTKLGELLKLERERRDIDLEAVSTELKIAEETLASIEQGDLAALPAELYFKLFAKSYAEYLGIDYAKTNEAIREEIGEDIEQTESGEPQSEDKPTRSEKKADEKKKQATGDSDLGPFIKKAGILAGSIVAGFIIFTVIYQLFLKSDAPAEDGTAVPGEAAEAQTEPATEARSLVADYDWQVPAFTPPDSIRLSLSARDQSWATVLADGDTVLYRNLVPGRRYDLAAKYRLKVSIGVPRLVEVSLDGQPAFLADPTSGRISRVMIDQTNRGQFGSPPSSGSNTGAQTGTTTEATGEV